MRILTYLLLLLIVILGISFASLNSQKVWINYYVGQERMVLSLLLVIVFVIGSLIGFIVGLWFYLKIKLKNYSLKQRLKMAEKEIQNLRTIPLKDRN